MIEFSMTSANLVYLRDVGVKNELGRVILRSDSAQDPYHALTGNNPRLNTLANQWNTVLPSSNHDLALLAGLTIGGGLANVLGGIGNPAYSVTGSSPEGDFSVIWRHEAAHNWGLAHGDGNRPEGNTINSGNTISRFSGPEQRFIIDHRIQRSVFLDSRGAYFQSIPPRASLDSGTYTPFRTPLLIDVLNNDHDANGNSFGLTDFQSVSRQAEPSPVLKGRVREVATNCATRLQKKTPLRRIFSPIALRMTPDVPRPVM